MTKTDLSERRDADDDTAERPRQHKSAADATPQKFDVDDIDPEEMEGQRMNELAALDPKDDSSLDDLEIDLDEEQRQREEDAAYDADEIPPEAMFDEPDFGPLIPKPDRPS